jgi:hypothetical protein
MERYRQVRLKQRKIFIRGEYGNLVARSYGADEKISVWSLNSLSSTEIEEISCWFVIAGCYFKVGESPQVIAQFLKLDLVLDSGEEFLTYRADHLAPHFSDQLD